MPATKNISDLVKEGRSPHKKDMAKLTPEAKAEMLRKREEKEVGRFFMPDAPSNKKQKRNSSPKRIPCPLVPGTPTTPPPRKRQPWEDDDNEARPGPSRDFEDVNLIYIPGPLLESSSDSLQKRSFDIEYEIGEEEEEEREEEQAQEILVEIIDRGELLPDAIVQQAQGSDDPAVFAKPSSKYVRPLRDQEIERDNLLNDLAGLCDSGSEDEIDIDTMDEEGLNPINIPRSAINFPAHVHELSESIVEQLLENDIRDSEALREIGDRDMLSFEWSSDPNIFCGVKETFTGEAGPTFATEGLTPLEIFEKIFDDTLIEEIVSQTNAYAHKLLSAPNLKPSSRLRRWKDCTKNEIWNFLAILMLQSLLPCPVEAEYWVPKSPLFKVSDFNSLMSYHRFVLIKKCIHFVDNATISQVTGPKKKLAKIQPIIDHLNNKFSSLYLPEQTIALDESLLLWKGRLSFAQLISNKAAQVGIKSFEICESRTGYLWQMMVYSGKGDKNPTATQDNLNENEPQNATSQIVLNLVRPLLNKGHILVMDNFYNSPLLSRILKEEKTDTMGTLRLNREFVPESLKSKNKSNLKPGEVAFSHTKDLSVVVWRDSNIVSLISTFHKPAVTGKEKFGYFKYKPQVVHDYNLSMGGVDKKDQLLQAYPIERLRNKVWYKKLFRRLLNVAIHNSYVIACHGKNVLHREFRRTLFQNIVTKYCPGPSNPKSSIALGGHYPTKSNTSRVRCKVCYAKNKLNTRTAYKCDTCNVNLCIVGCFKYYHENMYTAPV